MTSPCKKEAGKLTLSVGYIVAKMELVLFTEKEEDNEY
jgi:hypothetical protein